MRTASATGWLALPGGQLKIAAATQTSPTEGDALSATGYLRHPRVRLRPAFARLSLFTDQTPLFSCYDALESPTRAQPMAGATGWVRVQICR